MPVSFTSTGGQEEPRRAADSRVFPRMITHVSDERGENWVVAYAKTVLCLDEVMRRSVWYRCRRSDVPVGCPEAVVGHARARDFAYAHLEALTSDE
eukprot:12919000-Prorocentrum_lima.AAC.1